MTANEKLVEIKKVIDYYVKTHNLKPLDSERVLIDRLYNILNK